MGERVRVSVMMIRRRSVTQVSVLGQTQAQFVRRSLLLLVCVKVLPAELYIGVKYRSITQPRVVLITLSPPLNGGIFGAPEPYTYDRTLTYPLRFITWGTRETCFLGVHAQAFL